jgi:hypothetical protein
LLNHLIRWRSGQTFRRKIGKNCGADRCQYVKVPPLVVFTSSHIVDQAVLALDKSKAKWFNL